MFSFVKLVRVGVNFEVKDTRVLLDVQGRKANVVARGNTIHVKAMEVEEGDPGVAGPREELYVAPVAAADGPADPPAELEVVVEDGADAPAGDPSELLFNPAVEQLF